MTGIEQQQIEEAKHLIAKHLKTIPSFEKEATYLSYCITNGLTMDGHFFRQDHIGTVNRQLHSVRNIEKYPQHMKDIKKLNIELKRFEV